MKRSDGHSLSRTRLAPWRGILMAIAVFAAATGQTTDAWANCAIRANNPERTPDGNLTNHNNGTVTHTTTNLMWKMCPEGRTYSVGTNSCTGTTGSYSWQAAVRRAKTDTTGGNSDWRLPSRTELLSIVETGCASPAINTTRFPNVAASAAYWTSTHAGDMAPDSAYAVRFNHGISFIATKDFIASARLVRGGNTIHDYYRAAAPTEPAAFSFASQLSDPSPVSYDQDGNPVPRAVLSNIVNLTLGQSRSISITGGDYRIDGGAWTSAPPSAPGTITSGTRSLQLRVYAPYTTPGSASATVNVNGRTASFLVTTGTAPPDNIPDSFTFIDQTGVLPGTPVVSDPITVTGTNQATDIAITGGEYEINGIGNGPWSSVSGIGTVPQGATIRVKHTANASWGGGTTNTTLTLGPAGSTVFDTFTSTTAARDIAPLPIAFSPNNPKTGVDLDSVNTPVWVESDSITVSDINDAIDISVTGTAGRQSEYQIGTNGWTAVAGTVTNGQTVKVRHRSATGYLGSGNDTVQTTLTLGTVGQGAQTATFTSQTAALDTAPILLPDNFTNLTGVTRNNLQTTSNLLQITDINGPATVALVAPADASHQFQIVESSDGINPTSVVRDWGTASTTISNGQWVRVKHTAHANYSSSVSTTLTIGSPAVVRTFTSTTLAAPNDTEPDQFTFTDQDPVTLSTTVTSLPIAVTGISAATNATLTAGHFYSKDGTNFTSCPAPPTVCFTVVATDQVWVRHTSSGNELTNTDSVLTLGNGAPYISDTFTSRTGDKTPDPFANPNLFTDQSPVELSPEQATSNIITISGITIPADISVSGAATREFQVLQADGVTVVRDWNAASTTISNGQKVRVRHTNSASQTTPVNTTLTVGGPVTVSDTFTSTTGDSFPATFTTPNLFTDQPNVAVNTPFTSNAITVSGITISTAISVSGGEFQVLGTDGTTVVRDWNSTASTISNDQKVKVRHTSSTSNSTAVNTTITVGPAGNLVTETFTTTTVAPACGLTDWINEPNFTNITVDKDVVCYTANRAVTGLCANSTYTYTETVGSGGSLTRMYHTLNGEPLPAVGTTANNPNAAWLNAAVTSATITGTSANIRFLYRGESQQGINYTFKLKITDAPPSTAFHEKTWVVTTDGSTACPATKP